MSFFNFIMLTHSVLSPAMWLVEMQWREMKKWKMQNLNSNKLPFSLFSLQLSTSFFHLNSRVSFSQQPATTQPSEIAKHKNNRPWSQKEYFHFFFLILSCDERVRLKKMQYENLLCITLILSFFLCAHFWEISLPTPTARDVERLDCSLEKGDDDNEETQWNLI